MYLRPSDLHAQLLRPVGVHGAEFKFSDVRTRHAALLRFCDTFSVSDSLDTQLYTFKVGLKDFALATDTMAFAFNSSRSNGVASDSVAVGMRYLIDCFFGGLSFGGSPFGGRIV